MSNDLLDPDATLQEGRDALIGRLATLYARDRLDLAAFEDLVVQANACADLPALRGLVATCPALAEAPAEPAVQGREPQQINTNMGKVVREGRWLESDLVQLQASMGTVILDLRDYEDEATLDLVLELACNMSTIKLVLPRGFRAVEALDSNSMSTYKDHCRDGWDGRGTVRLTGHASMSTIKVNYR